MKTVPVTNIKYLNPGDTLIVVGDFRGEMTPDSVIADKATILEVDRQINGLHVALEADRHLPQVLYFPNGTDPSHRPYFPVRDRLPIPVDVFHVQFDKDTLVCPVCGERADEMEVCMGCHRPCCEGCLTRMFEDKLDKSGKPFTAVTDYCDRPDCDGTPSD